MATALIPGTYDPITLGHIDVIKRASQIFDHIIVGVADSPHKRGHGTLFSLDDRVRFVQDAIDTYDDLASAGNVEVRPFTRLLVDFAVEVGAQVIVKGLRAVTDFESEFQQASLNYHMNPELETAFIMATPQNMYLSSSVVKEISELGGDVDDLVTPLVARALKQEYAAAQ
ncbi:MAG: pantetheine-phosphate adenylyltransferase [Coriobacteriales bacterium]|jgi:pantetheine-phosphate adenylyltransferase|nr:pantetheine-phosphate adenylyltransferase [Coriobacteriales bacterium]